MTAGAIDVQINGEARAVPVGLTVTRLLVHLDLQPRLVVVERNGDILSRNRYDEVEISAGDVLELVHFVGGG